MLRLREDPAKLERIARIMRTISHPARLMIIEYLLKNGRSTVKAIYEAIDLSQSNASQHLKLMEQVDILSNEREGTCIYYQVSNPGMERLLKSACDCTDN